MTITVEEALYREARHSVREADIWPTRSLIESDKSSCWSDSWSNRPVVLGEIGQLLFSRGSNKIAEARKAFHGARKAVYWQREAGVAIFWIIEVHLGTRDAQMLGQRI